MNTPVLLAEQDYMQFLRKTSNALHVAAVGLPVVPHATNIHLDLTQWLCQELPCTSCAI